MDTVFLAIDAGSTALKVIAFSGTFKEIAKTSADFFLDRSPKGGVEFDPEGYWNDIADTIRKTLQRIPKPFSVAAVGISSHTDTLIALDINDHPLYPGIFWYDNRAESAVLGFKTAFPDDSFFLSTGQSEPNPILQGVKLKWFLETHTEEAARTVRYFQTADYICYKLTGEFALDRSVACCTGMVGLKDGTYLPQALEAIGIKERQLPRILEPGTVVGTVCPSAARRTGLPVTAKVTAGSMDQTTAALASGNIVSSIVTECTGTVLSVCSTIDKPLFNGGKSVALFNHVIPNRYLVMVWHEVGGLALKWFRDGFYHDLPERCPETDLYDFVTGEAADAPPGCDGLLTLPLFAGSGPPEYNPKAKAVFFGIGLHHGRPHFARSVMEGIGFLLKSSVDTISSVLQPVRADIQEIRSTGGGAKSPLWCRIKADILGKPVTSLMSEELAGRGAAILAAVGTGAYPSVEKAIAAQDLSSTTYYPEPLNMGIYSKSYGTYRKILQGILPLFLDT